jgi:peptide/nickel transport system substrate-binding protein
MYRKSVGFLSIVSVCLFAVLTACGGGSSAIESGHGNVSNSNRLVVAMEGDAVSLDPHLSNITISSQFNVQLYETLVQLDHVTGEPFGVLAESWERYDDYSYIFHLKQNVYFHDGQQMTAEDVAFSLERAANSPAVAAIMEDFDPANIEIIDEFTVRIGTREPFAPFLNNIAHPAAAILSQYSFNLLGEQGFGENPVGTGPFEFHSRVMGDYVEFRRFDDYHGDLPAFEELQLRVVTEPSNRLIELETGNADIAFIGRNDMERVENTTGLRLERMTNYQIFYMGMNTNRINDVRVRQAISYAVDVETIHATIMYGIGEMLTGPLSRDVFGARLDLPGFGFDQERAIELLEEANFDFSQTLTIATNEFPERLEWAQAISGQLSQIGIQADVVPLENPIFIDETADGMYDMFILAWTTVTGDGDYGLFPLFHSSNHGAAGNRTFFNHPRADELMELGRTNFDPEARIAYYGEVQQIIHDEAPFLFLATGELVLGTRDGVNGVYESMGPANHVRFQHVTFD